jgi:prevent-host-death family protein
VNAETITVAQARSDFSNIIAQTELQDRRFIIARRGRAKAALISMKDLARLEALDRAGAPGTEREYAIQALRQSGLLRSLSPELRQRYLSLEPEQQDETRQALAQRRFEPPLSEQIIEDRGEE